MASDIISARQEERLDEDKPGHIRIRHRYLSELRHPPVNDKLYRPIRKNDPAVIALARSIGEHGVKEPLVITMDDYIISGNRRATAAEVAGLVMVPCRTELIRHTDPEFVTMLREYNRQRVKSVEELAREAVVDTAARQGAHRQLLQYREARSRDNCLEDIEITIDGQARRSTISAAKMPMLEAALAVMRARRAFWPLTVRQVHYGLLNDPPLRHASKPDSRYGNTLQSYKDLCDLLIRARLEGSVSWNAIDDPTRPIFVWNVWDEVSGFVEREMRDFLRNYHRDLQQSQPCHIEVIGEKNTLTNILRPVVADYCVPMTLGRGYASGSPRKKIAQRFLDSGKERLGLLVVSDHDPEGEDIPQSLGRSLRDEFDLEPDSISLVKVALTAEQVRHFHLPPVMTAKAKSSRRAAFVDEFGDVVHELEALDPEQLQRLLREAIESVMDVDLFHEEQEREAEDAVVLERMRRGAMDAIGTLDADDDQDDEEEDAEE